MAVGAEGKEVGHEDLFFTAPFMSGDTADNIEAAGTHFPDLVPT